MNESAAQVIDRQDQLIIKEFGIEEITTANIALMEKQILEIPEKPETKEQYDASYRFNVDAKKLLPRIEERRKELKAPVLEKGKAIDDTAKKAVAMVQPLVELSGTRRQAWEDQKAEEKAEKDRIENERLASIQAKIDMINHLAKKPTEYNRSAEDLTKDLAHLEAVEISAIDFQERTEEAEIIRNHAIETAKIALENRKKFEADQAEAARVKAEQEAEAKRLEAEREKLEMERKAQELAALEAAEAEAERIRLKEEAIQAEREKLEHDKVVAEREAVWDVAHQENVDRDHAAAIIEHEKYKADLQAEIDKARAAAKEDWERSEKYKAEAAAREKLVGPDRMMLTTIATDLEKLLSDYEIPKLNTDEANALVLDLIASLKTRIYGFEQRGEQLR